MKDSPQSHSSRRWLGFEAVLNGLNEALRQSSGLAPRLNDLNQDILSVFGASAVTHLPIRFAD